jgi:hypothetical protein
MLKRTIASTLIVSTIVTSSTSKVDACDAAAVMETAKEASMACPYIAPVVITGAAIITGVTTVIGIKNRPKEETIYQTLGHLPDAWRPNSVIEKIKPNGKVVQRRFYGPTGKPEIDVDLTNHGTPEYHPFGHGGAHKHTYKYGKRSRGMELTDEEYDAFIKNFDRNKADRMTVQPQPEVK